jgi:hypothetical protein
MLFLSVEAKREKLLSEGLFLHAQGDKKWFDAVKKQIDNGIMANPGRRFTVLIQWIMTAERMNSSIMKNEIITQYNLKERYDQG